VKPRFCRLFHFVFLWIAGAGAMRGAPPAESQVTASLVSSVSTVEPGKPFTVALRLVHAPTWHTYWVNPGTGLATSIKWTLPPGWKSGDIEWPVPHVIKDRDGNVTGNGYDGDLLLPVLITPPADAKGGSTAVLTAAADWLMCQNVCVPGNATVSSTLTVRAGPATPDAEWGPKIAAVLAKLPRADAGWTVEASRDPKGVTVRIARGKGVAASPTDPHFFSTDGLIAFDQPQTAAGDNQGGFSLRLPVSADAPADVTALHGVLAAHSGWRSDGSVPGLQIDVPFAGSAAGSSSSVTPVAAAAPPAGGLLGTLCLAFFGGLILNLMPCVFPVLGIKILGFVNQAGTDRRKVVTHGLSFAAGVFLSFWALAGLLAILRHGGAQLGWGFQLQSPVFVFGLAAGLLVFALNLSGVFEFGLGATSIGGSFQTKGGYSGSFFTGVLATVVATPCSAPFLAPALGAALTLSVGASFAVFSSIALGLSTPYLLLSAFPAAIKLLPRPGAWMETFKQFMAFPLYATVGGLMWVLAGQVSEGGYLDLILGLVVVALGVWVYGRFNAPGASLGRTRFGLVAGLALLALGAWFGWPRAQAPEDIVWEKWSPAEVAKLHQEGRIVYVDFTARWCATCQANKKVVFHSNEVLRAFHDKHIATLRGDWTNQDPAITAELAKYHRSAVPFNQVWVPGKPDPVILSELLRPADVLKAVGR
jgi:thiol:disulfide interchange protein/DsbC/DsbD-like thiol-disulfide interchange protein